jgi:4-amino-4-deoxy-L-arabinose transferase-like glycosyltransferase
MSSSFTPGSRLVHALILTALSIPYCLSLGVSSLWDSSEAFYAETPREMIATGDYLAPRFNSQVRAQKPPLTYWIIAGSYKLFGVHERSVRLPGALAAVGLLLFTYGIAKALFGARAALVAAAITATVPRLFIVARRLPIDILLLFWLAATAYFIIRGTLENSRRHWILAYACAAAGFLTKGPVAVALPAASYLLWLLWSRRFRSPAVHPWLGVLIISAIVVPWYVLIYLAHGWTYIGTFFLKDNLGRFASESFGPTRGLFYYVPAFLADFFPWSLFVPAALYETWRTRSEQGGPARLATGFPLCWCGFIFLFFSLSKNKQEYYIAGMYPMMAVLIAGAMDRALFDLKWREPRSLRIWARSFFAVAAALLAGSVLIVVFSSRVLPDVPFALHLVPLLILFVTFAVLAWNIVRAMPWRCFTWLAAALWFLFVVVAAAYVPSIERYRPVKELCRVIDQESGPDDESGYFRLAAPSMVFYLRRPIFEEYDPDAMVRRFQSPRRVLCLMTERDYDYFAGTRDLILYVLDRRPRLTTRLRGVFNQSDPGEQEMLLVSNKPGSESGARTDHIAR